MSKFRGICKDTGYDLFEEAARASFESYVSRKGYNTEMLPYGIFYKDEKTEDAWRLYHHGHVAGRGLLE